jgi:hypothetical protein
VIVEPDRLAVWAAGGIFIRICHRPFGYSLFEDSLYKNVSRRGDFYDCNVAFPAAILNAEPVVRPAGNSVARYRLAIVVRGLEFSSSTRPRRETYTGAVHVATTLQPKFAKVKSNAYSQLIDLVICLFGDMRLLKVAWRGSTTGRTTDFQGFDRRRKARN